MYALSNTVYTRGKLPHMTRYAADRHPVNTSRNKSSALASRSDLCVPWNLMCYTSSLFAKPPAAMLPIPPTYRWQCSLTPYTHLIRYCTRMHFHKNIYTYTTGMQLMACSPRAEPNIWQNISTLRCAIFIIQILFQLSWHETVFSQFLSHI